MILSERDARGPGEHEFLLGYDAAPSVSEKDDAGRDRSDRA
jgi:hypothetical protein